MFKEKGLCPVCNEFMFKEEYEICKICGWEHDYVQEEDENFWGGANELSLREASTLYNVLKNNQTTNTMNELLKVHKKKSDKLRKKRNSLIDSGTYKMYEEKMSVEFKKEHDRFVKEIYNLQNDIV
ncbi:MAG: hypothetical protein FWF46_06770 [Oscillospiraceae bacterium]|nr:hypothetical protein [Oscillospiraceae bacterium]